MSTSARSSQVSPPTQYDALGQGLAELKTTIESTMQNCDNQRCCGADSQDENEQRRKDTDAFYDAMRTDVAEIARMAAAERQKAASHAIDMLNQLRMIVEENHRLVLSLTEETFQNLAEGQQIRHAEVLKTIQESRRKR